MEIGLFGGTFNPPHIAHLIIAETVYEECGLDRIWWMPTATPPHKSADDHIAAPEHRLEMCRRATNGNDHFYVSELEIERSGVSYTVDTVRQLTSDHPRHTFHLIMGGDMFVDFPSWRSPDEILEHVSLIVYARPGTDVSSVGSQYRRSASIVQTPLLGISGTDIRQRFREGRSCRYRVPDEVRSYLSRHELY